MPVSHQHRAIFIHIPKCAGTSVEYALGMHGELEHIGIEPYINQTTNPSTLFGKGAQHFTCKQIRAAVGEEVFNQYFKFTIVRNPWERFISHLAWKRNKQGELKWINKIPLDQAEVDEAIEALFSTQNHSHLSPQHEYITDDQGNILVDQVCRYENLTDEWLAISSKLAVSHHLEKRMLSNHKHYSQYLSDHQANQVAEFYQTDIELFGYEFERV